MVTEWVLVIWMLNKYPMTDRMTATAATIVDTRFNTESDCKKAGDSWVDSTDHRKYVCFKIEREIQTNAETL